MTFILPASHANLIPVVMVLSRPVVVDVTTVTQGEDTAPMTIISLGNSILLSNLDLHSIWVIRPELLGSLRLNGQPGI